MRSATLLYAGVMFLILEVAIICSITSKSAYADSVRQSLEDAIEFSVCMLQEGQRDRVNENIVSGSIASSDLYANVDWQGSWASDTSDLTEFKKDFVECLVKQLDSKVTSIEVNIYGADEKNGLLSVEVTAYFRYLSGQTGSVSCYRTMIINKIEK